jgi:hypothetical protein
MRIYDGSPRQDFEEVFRAIGGYLDRRGMREVLITEAPDGFIAQGLTMVGSTGRSEAVGLQVKETVMFIDDDISRFLDDGIARRGRPNPGSDAPPGYYEQALRVLGRFIDERRPRDVFLFEQGGSYLLRLLMGTQMGTRHELFEFTGADVHRLIAEAQAHRQRIEVTHPGSAGR